MAKSHATKKRSSTRASSTGSAADRRDHERWLTELTALPTAAGREGRVIRWVEQWLKTRRNLTLSRDKAGNLFITQKKKVSRASILLQAHLDHPAFVVREIDNRDVELEFRGGVLDPYFDNARIEIFDEHDTAHRATITRLDSGAQPFKRATARLSRSAGTIQPGDVGRWVFSNHKNLPRVSKGIFHTHACDDLAAVAAALAALDGLRNERDMGHVGVLLTRAEEVGFIGTLACCRDRSAPKNARIICLENSRSFPESPIGAGPILRVGDRVSVFEPTLTNRISSIMVEHEKSNPDFNWQRKLMPGGRCEATGFSSFGYQSTCLCLPLGNYHNMQDIDGVRAGNADARVGPEYISINDYHGLIEMLKVSCAELDGDIGDLRAQMQRELREREFVLAE